MIGTWDGVVNSIYRSTNLSEDKILSSGPRWCRKQTSEPRAELLLMQPGQCQLEPNRCRAPPVKFKALSPDKGKISRFRANGAASTVAVLTLHPSFGFLALSDINAIGVRHRFQTLSETWWTHWVCDEEELIQFR